MDDITVRARRARGTRRSVSTPSSDQGEVAVPRVRSGSIPVSGRKGRWLEKKNAIVKAASRLFSERGFNYVSLDDVAEQLGIGKPVIYYYFESKEQILFECYSLAFDVGDEVMRTALALEGDARTRLEYYLREYLLAHLRGEAPLVPMHDILALSEPLRGIIERRRRNRRDRLRKLIAAGQEDGSLGPCDPRVAVSAWGGASAWVIGSFDPRKGLSPEETAEYMVGLFLNGLLPRKVAK
ncbi:TetR/AcrR family transcriptional regulator [uncultured Pigmentiphaga sp.]|mgnify:CR=1 FL=1|uniref:TetR/AcrR family transcriptional regulator n=1 Tax=uncultured Pigmentiphaga sp. TaxID=340361 RepID=UPI002626842C|nr:TetR/AcrR family transcriptional regulator [uncultured Pigmentiphaga sp.]